MDYACSVFGQRFVRKLTTADIVTFSQYLRDRGVSDATRGKHLRVLGACLNSALAHGYAAANPARMLPKGEKPRQVKKESAYFEDGELGRLFAELEKTWTPYRLICLAAVKTGMRLGELVALTFGDIDFFEGVIRVRSSYTGGERRPPKNHEVRSVDIPSDLVDELAEWRAECGDPGGEFLVFPGDTGGYMEGTVLLRRELYPAMAKAGVPREGPTGEKRTFHSFRHSYAKRCLESGADISWLQRQLGHYSITLTVDRYGHRGREKQKAQVALLEEKGAFKL
jgi:integrase